MTRETEQKLAELNRELRLARQDIDTPRPEFWEADLARYRAARAAISKATGALDD